MELVNEMNLLMFLRLFSVDSFTTKKSVKAFFKVACTHLSFSFHMGLFKTLNKNNSTIRTSNLVATTGVGSACFLTALFNVTEELNSQFWRFTNFFRNCILLLESLELSQIC